MKQRVLTAVFLSAALAAFAQQGVIRDLSGTVELKRAGAASFTVAKQGDFVARDTIVSTGFKSTAIIAVGSTTLTVLPITRLSLAEIVQAQGSERTNVNLEAGRVRAEVRPPVGSKADVTIKTPSSTASVRGTIFEIDTYTITVIEGTVAYSGANGGLMLVSGGSASQVDSVTRRVLDPIDVGSNIFPAPPIGADEPTTRQGGSSDVELILELSF
jgi:hypothetical protein